MANIKDIAKHLGVSVSTVSRAMNNHADVSEETKRRVKEAAQALHYRPNAIAKGLIQKKSFTIGLMVPEIADPFFSGIADGVEETLSKQGYQVVYDNTKRNPDKEKQFVAKAIERQYDGLIITPDFLDDEMIQLLSILKIPVVFLRRRTPAALPMPFVDVDHYEAAITAIHYLINLGHREIGFISMPASSFTGNERLRGYQDALRQHGLNAQPIVVGGRTIENGREAMGKLHSAYPNVTAVFAANDLLGIGALEWLAVHQKQVPHMSVIGFDNLEYGELYWIRLTTMAQPRKEMGSRAAQLLLQMITNKDQPPPESELIQAKLVVRESCGSRKEMS